MPEAPATSIGAADGRLFRLRKTAMLSRHWRLWLSFPPTRSLPKTIFLFLRLDFLSSIIFYEARGFAPAGATRGFPIASGRFGPPLDDKPIQTGGRRDGGGDRKAPAPRRSAELTCRGRDVLTGVQLPRPAQGKNKKEENLWKHCKCRRRAA